MLHSFTSDEFLTFAKDRNESVINQGILELDNERAFPYFIVFRTNPMFPDGANFIITPICFSGPEVLKNDDLEKIRHAFADYELAGGFLQSREVDSDKALFKENPLWFCYSDSRTNFRIPLGLADEDLTVRMKRDSRTRTRKLIKQNSHYKLIKAGSNKNDEIREFAEMYDQIADRTNFPAHYRFSERKWCELLENPEWNLYLLEYNDQLISGSIIANLGEGFDYTFMGYRPEYMDASRANVYFLYRYLSEKKPKGYIDLGGGILESDSLESFKSGMGADRTSFKRLRFIFKSGLKGYVDETDIFTALTTRWP